MISSSVFVLEPNPDHLNFIVITFIFFFSNCSITEAWRAILS